MEQAYSFLSESQFDQLRRFWLSYNLLKEASIGVGVRTPNLR
jgi:hypothetical protein